MTDAPQVSEYAKTGVDAGKAEVRQAFASRIDNDFPGAFVNIKRDPEQPGIVFTQHMDGDGSKLVQRLLIYEETHDASVLRGACDDALSMNLGDMACAGFVNAITVTDVININGFNAPKKEVMEHVASRLAELRELYRSHGITLYFLGGETADLPDQVRSAVFDIAVHARAKESDIISGAVRPGDKIWGFASDGKADWEDRTNSGIMSNGLTLARQRLMHEDYTKQYPHLIRQDGAYAGSYRVGDYEKHFLGAMSVSDALVSPTRQWAILVKRLIDALRTDGKLGLLHGMSLNTGGGATKIGHVGQGGICYLKHSMPEPAGIFRLVQWASGESWKNMYQGFNCGVGLDIVGAPALEPYLRQVEAGTSVRLYELGECESSTREDNTVILGTEYGRFTY